MVHPRRRLRVARPIGDSAPRPLKRIIAATPGSTFDVDDLSGRILEHSKPALRATAQPLASRIYGVATRAGDARKTDCDHGKDRQPNGQQASMKRERVVTRDPTHADCDNGCCRQANDDQ
jgi:hypothetical protein